MADYVWVDCAVISGPLSGYNGVRMTPFIRCLENGYTADLLPVTAVTSDPDVWSYLVRMKIGLRCYSLLQAAAALGHAERIPFLLERGAAIDMLSIDSAMPLHLATLHGWTGAVHALISGGTDVHACLPAAMLVYYNLLRAELPSVKTLSIPQRDS